MNDSVEIQSPPSKKFKQAEIAIETNSDNKDIEKENKPIDEDSPSVDDGSFIRSTVVEPIFGGQNFTDKLTIFFSRSWREKSSSNSKIKFSPIDSNTEINNRKKTIKRRNWSE